LIVFAGAASGALQQDQQDQTVTIHVSTPRPLASAIEELENRYGWVITYEDPRYVYACDFEDLTLAVRKDYDLTKRVLVPRGGPFTFRYAVSPSADAPDGSALLERLLQEYHLTGYPGVFRLIRTGSVFHIVPSESRNTLGQFEPHVSLLSANISITDRDRTAFAMLEAITAAMSRPGSARVGIGTVPVNLLMQVRVQGGARNERARTVLLRTLEATNQKLSWSLLCDPGPTPMCALNVYFVGNR
jgi:hypothetical protein